MYVLLYVSYYYIQWRRQLFLVFLSLSTFRLKSLFFDCQLSHLQTPKDLFSFSNGLYTKNRQYTFHVKCIKIRQRLPKKERQSEMDLITPV